MGRTDTLAEVERALANDDELAALAAALAAWRICRAPPIAGLVAAISRRFEPHLPDIAGPKTKHHAAWLAIAARRHPVDLPRLIRSMAEATGQGGMSVEAALRERTAALVAWPADPRATTEVVARLATSRPHTNTKLAREAMFRVLHGHDDPRAIAMLAALDPVHVLRHLRGYTEYKSMRARLEADLAAALAEFRARHPDGPPAPPPSVVTTCKKLVAQLARRKPIGAAVVAQLAGSEPAVAAVPVRAKPARRAVASSDGLARAVQAVERGDDDAALAGALETWRANRAPAIAETIERISARIEATRPAITGDNRKKIQASWLALAARREPADLPRLLDSITLTFGRSTDALARVRALADWPSDPRTATGVVHQLGKPAFYASSTKPFWNALIQLVVAHADPRAIAALGRLRFDQILVSAYQDLSSTIAWFEREVKAAIAALRAHHPDGPPAASPADAAYCARLDAARAPDAALLAEIADQPDDDHARLVYADQLQLAGDPRGELIALQLAARDPERQRELVAAHGRTWLGPLAPLVDLEDCRFERGFPVTIALRDGIGASAIAAVAGDPVWSSVRRLDLAGTPKLPVELVRHPTLRSLDHLGGLARTAMLELLEWKTIPYRSLGWLGPDEWSNEDARADIAAFVRAAPKLARLRALDLVGGDELRNYRWLWSSPIGSRLERLAPDTGVGSIAAWQKEIARLKLELPTLELSQRGGGIELTRGADGRLSVADAQIIEIANKHDRPYAFSYAKLTAALASVPRDALTVLRVHARAPRKAERAALLAACARFRNLALELPA